MKYRKHFILTVSSFLFLLPTSYCREQQSYEAVCGWQETKEKRGSLQWLRIKTATHLKKR